jgi:signal transduction histidine kinase
MISGEIPNNRLLQMLDAEARADISPLVRVDLRAREVLHEPGVPSLYAYFPTNGVISLVSTMAGGASTEVAVVGREGMVGLAGVLGNIEGPTTAVVQIAGTAFRTKITALRTARLTRTSMRTVLDLYTEARLIQTAQMAACNRLHSLESRLARWLLATHDRIDGDEFILPQEFIADTLGVHRPAISVALQRFRERGAIEYRGRTVIVAERRVLEDMACECHGVLHREFERLLQPAHIRAQGLPGMPIAGASRPDTEPTAAIEAMREIAGRLLLVSIREQEAREEAEAAVRFKDQFIATVSHELRTPLNAIMGWCRILSEQRPDHGLEVIERNARAQLSLVEDLLDAARMTSETLTIEREQVNLRCKVWWTPSSR